MKHTAIIYVNLYAVFQRGANVILPVAVAGNGTALPLPEVIAEHTMGLVSTSGGIVFDAAGYFGCNRTKHEKKHQSTMSYSMCHHKVTAIRTTAACSGLLTPDVACDTRMPPVALSKGTFTPVHLDGALFTSEAFWALPVALVADSEERLLWSLVVQRLVWLSGNHVVVRRCTTGLDTTASRRLLPAIDRLDNWLCKAATMKQCILDVVTDNRGLLSDQTALLVGYWVESLSKSGYAFPQFDIQVYERCETVELHAVDHSVPPLGRNLQAEVYTPVTNLDSITSLYNNTCRRHDTTLPRFKNVDFAQPWTQFNDVLLVITFNNPHYESIPYVESLYRPFFPNILYCGPSSIENVRSADIGNYTLSFISYENIDGHAAGSYNYKCMLTALKMDYNVRGILVASDDLLLLVNTLARLKKQAMWYVPKETIYTGDLHTLKECRYGNCKYNPGWVPWHKYKRVTMNALAEIANNTKSATMRQCHQRLLGVNGAPMRANGALSDVFYIPRSLWRKYVDVFELFLRHKVFLEIAVPTTIKCLVDAKDVDPLIGEAHWFNNKFNPWVYFKTKESRGRSFFHSIKWGYLARNVSEYNTLYCTKIMPYLHDRLATPID